MPQKANIAVEQFQSLFEVAPASFLVLLPDADFTIVGVTDDYLRNTFKTREEILGKPVFEAFPDNPQTPEANSTKNLSASLKCVIATKSTDTMAIQRYDVPSPDGRGFEVRYWSPVNRPVFSADGELAYIIHRVENVTDYMRLLHESEAQQQRTAELSEQNRKMEAAVLQSSLDLERANSELKNANQTLTRYAEQVRHEARLKDEFLAMLAHELRNPLAGISAAIELLGLVENDPAQLAQIRDICRRQIGNLTRMVDDLLDVSRISRGTVELRREPLDLRDIVESALHATRGLLDQHNLAVSTNITPGTYTMLGDTTRLEQVMTNLLANAAKYSDSGAQVTINLTKETASNEQWAILQVKDAGRGIPPDRLNDIFNLFVQVDTTMDRARGGLGIGLTLVQKLVELHGGTVKAQSQGMGYGSTFTVHLPISSDASLSPSSIQKNSASLLPKGTRNKILIIEDNVDAREALKALLKAYGYEVEVANDGVEGLQLLQTVQPEIAIIDIGLPGLDGFEVARRTREALGDKALKLVALSGYSDPDTKGKAINAGFDLHLVKPLNPAELASILKKD